MILPKKIISKMEPKKYCITKEDSLENGFLITELLKNKSRKGDTRVVALKIGPRKSVPK